QVELEAPPIKLELLLRMAVIFRDRLRRPERALRAFERMLEIDEKHLGAAEGLIPLYGANDGAKLVRVLAIQLEHTGDPAAPQAAGRAAGAAGYWCSIQVAPDGGGRRSDGKSRRSRTVGGGDRSVARAGRQLSHGRSANVGAGGAAALARGGARRGAAPRRR